MASGLEFGVWSSVHLNRSRIATFNARRGLPDGTVMVWRPEATPPLSRARVFCLGDCFKGIQGEERGLEGFTPIPTHAAHALFNIVLWEF